MELRHLRYFVAVAEELHFARAAVRLHIEQSPLSRAIRELESELRVELFKRDRQGTQLTFAGEEFLVGVRRTIFALDQAKRSAEDASKGYRGVLRIVLSDAVSPQRLGALLARCRLDEPEVAIHLTELPLAHQLKGLQRGLFDAGFAQTEDSYPDLLSYAVWDDPIAMAIPARHPLLVHKEVELSDVLRYPLILPDRHTLPGTFRQIQQMLDGANGLQQPDVIAHVVTFDLMLALVSAGYGLGFSTESQLAAYHQTEVVSRPLVGVSTGMTTYLLRPSAAISPELDRFADRARSQAINTPTNSNT
ncbi:LysR family transcriptional regulator [Burkholderia gladioli]|uniref:LysR family transcriptional regulator n=1 Tax=Burkholderia gladioli TaxID=28095 RepID=UPI001640AAA7|nr:LysR family transcriptional regulator [Burkholderia gladioli]